MLAVSLQKNKKKKREGKNLSERPTQIEKRPPNLNFNSCPNSEILKPTPCSEALEDKKKI
jgi:hypothetical protein